MSYARSQFKKIWCNAKTIFLEQLIEHMVEQAEKLETGGVESSTSQEGSMFGESGWFSVVMQWYLLLYWF